MVPGHSGSGAWIDTSLPDYSYFLYR